MTPQEALKVLENEKECIQRQVNGNCDNKRDCANCDLRLEDKEIILAYNTAIFALEKQIPKKCTDGFHKEKFIDGRCPNCSFRQSKGDIQWKRQFNKYCRNCGQALDWSDSE